MLLRVLNESSHLQNAQHFLRGLRWWDMRCPFSQEAENGSRERDMHRLIREKWKPFGEGMRTVISLEGIL